MGWAFDSSGSHLGLAVAICVLPVLWFLPGAVLITLVRYELGKGGPWLRVHVPLNVAFIAWCVYAVQVLREDIHGANSPLITIPQLLIVALFYGWVFSVVLDTVPDRLRAFSRTAAACNFVAFVVLMVVWLRM